MKKLLPVAGLLCASITHLFGAYSNGSCPTKTCPPKDCAPKVQPPLDCNCPPPDGKINDCMPCVITPAAGPRVADGVDVFVTADFIYWTVREDGLGYATSGWRNDTAEVDPAKGHVKHAANKFKPGFKVGLGLNLGHDGWDTFAQYTWLYTGGMNNSVSQDSIDTTTLRPLWFVGADLSPNTPITSASSHYNIHLNEIDWELGRNFFVSRYLKIRPHFGLKGAWYNKDFHVTYVTDPASVAINTYNMKQDQDFWGVGIRTGFNTAWHFTKSFSIVGNIAFAGLWSQFEVDRKDSEYNATDAAVATEIALHTENSYHILKPVMELFLGLRWDAWFSDDDFHLSIDAGWEEQMWFNHNQLYRIYEESSHGDLGTQGLTVHVRFDF